MDKAELVALGALRALGALDFASHIPLFLLQILCPEEEVPIHLSSFPVFSRA